MPPPTTSTSTLAGGATEATGEEVEGVKEGLQQRGASTGPVPETQMVGDESAQFAHQRSFCVRIIFVFFFCTSLAVETFEGFP
jgi:hypothetical protein